MKLILAATLAALAAPVFADELKMDPATMMCSDLMAMDMDGMMSAGAALKAAMMEDAKMAAMSDEDVMKAAEEACKAHMDAKVMDAMHM